MSIASGAATGTFPAHPGAEPRGLALGAQNKAEWDQPAARRRGLRELHRLHRYGLSIRAPRVLELETRLDFRLHDIDALRWYLSHPFFTGIAVLAGRRIALEHYAADFGPDQVHSIQSISKTAAHLMAGRLIESGLLDPDERIARYLPEIGSGYAEATVQDALDMAVVNDYSEDFYDPTAMVGRLEDAHGWRLSGAPVHIDIRTFLTRIGAGAGGNPARRMHYKSANTDVIAWICERVGGRNLRDLLIDIIEGFGAADAVYVSTDRYGTPFVGGGLHMTLRDLARYGLFLGRAGQTLGGARIGSVSFRDATRSDRAKGTPSLLGEGCYRNFLETDGTWIGHNGYGGQWLMVYPDSDIVIACLSGIADDGGLDWGFIRRLAALGSEIARALGHA
jgi:CubicO group peptidase (beta-lactamase class C family)